MNLENTIDEMMEWGGGSLHSSCSRTVHSPIPACGSVGISLSLKDEAAAKLCGMLSAPLKRQVGSKGR